MKKRLLSALLALALVFVLLPTTALADTTPVTDENVKINGTAVIVGNDISLGEGNGTYSYDKATHTLTLNSATINATDSNIGISFGVPVKRNIDYKIELVGNNSITSTSAQAIYVEHDTSVEAWENDTMKRSTLTINGSAGSQLILNASGYEKEAIWSKGDFTLSGGTAVTAFSSGKIAVNVGSMTINNSKLSAQSSSYGTTVVLYGFEMIGDAAEFEALNTSSGVRAVLRTSGASENIDWSKYQLITGSYSGNALTKSEPTVCDKNTLNDLFSSSSTTRYIHIAKRTIPALQRTSDVLIAKENAVVGVETSIPSANGSGTYYYDQASKTLTLNNVNIASSSIINGIQFTKDGTYTINLVGTNTISDVSNGISVTDDKYITSLNVTITGTGSLDISARGLAINMKKGDLKFENTGEIKLTTSNISPTHNVLSVSGNITIADMEKYKVEGIVQDNTKDGGDTVTLSEASHLKGYENPDGTAICFKSITITPAAAKDSTISYDGKTLKQGEIIKDENGGTATVATKGNTITLNNFKGTKALSFEATLADSTLVLEGTSTLSSIVTTQKGLTISGSGSLTVGSIRVTNNDNISADLTITDGAAVIAGTATSDAKAIDITGNLTVNSGATLTATNTSETKPTIDVTGNVTISGNPGTNAYTVSAHNSYNVQKDRVGNLSPSGVPSAIKIGGTLNISAGARVMAQTDSYGAGVMLGQNSTITVEDAFLSAKNSSCDFAAISFSGQTGKIYVSGEKGKVVAENIHTGTNLKFRAINAFVYNSNTNFYLKMQSEGVIAEAANKIIAPGKHDASGGKKVTITRGDEVTRTNSPVVIAGTTLLNDTYYTITNGSKVAEGTENNYNAFYNSKTKTLKLNNAQISHSFAHENGGGRDGAIIFTKFENYFIELSGENTISSTNTYAINCHRPDRTLTIKNAAGAENAKLTLTSNWMVVCSIGGLNIQSDVTMVNTKEAGYLMYVNDTFSFDGYNAYASVNASGSPLVEYTVPTSGDKDAGYQYLRITKETLETGGGSTHEHVFSTSWESNADYHWHKCTVQGCTEVSDKEAHVYTNTWWKNSNGNHGRTCDKCRHEGEIHEFRKYYDFVDATYHVERCSYPNCTYVGSNETHSYDSFGVCKCGYSPNGLPAPPSLQGVAPTSENGTDGKILNSNIGMEYAQNLNGPWTKWNEHSNITGLSAGTYYVRYTKTDERFPDNQVATVEVPAYTPGGDPTPDIPAAPTGLVGVAPTSENGNGKITGTTAQMEYASSLEGDWTTCANDSTDVPAGKYYVRMKKTDNTPAGEAVEVTVPAYSGTGEITPDPTPDNPGTIVIIRPAEEEKPAQQPNPSTGANDLVGLAVAAAVAAALGSAALLRKHD